MNRRWLIAVCMLVLPAALAIARLWLRGSERAQRTVNIAASNTQTESQARPFAEPSSAPASAATANGLAPSNTLAMAPASSCATGNPSACNRKERTVTKNLVRRAKSAGSSSPETGAFSLADVRATRQRRRNAQRDFSAVRPAGLEVTVTAPVAPPSKPAQTVITVLPSMRVGASGLVVPDLRGADDPRVR